MLGSVRFHAVPRVWIYRVCLSALFRMRPTYVYVDIGVGRARVAVTRHFAHTVGVCEVGRDRVY